MTVYWLWHNDKLFWGEGQIWSHVRAGKPNASQQDTLQVLSSTFLDNMTAPARLYLSSLRPLPDSQATGPAGAAFLKHPTGSALGHRLQSIHRLLIKIACLQL